MIYGKNSGQLSCNLSSAQPVSELALRRLPAAEISDFLAYRNGVVVGYSVLRCTISEELRQGIIVDVFADRRDLAVSGDLIWHAVGHFRA